MDHISLKAFVHPHILHHNINNMNELSSNKVIEGQVFVSLREKIHLLTQSYQVPLQYMTRYSFQHQKLRLFFCKYHNQVSKELMAMEA